MKRRRISTKCRQNADLHRLISTNCRQVTRRLIWTIWAKFVLIGRASDIPANACGFARGGNLLRSRHGKHAERLRAERAAVDPSKRPKETWQNTHLAAGRERSAICLVCFVFLFGSPAARSALICLVFLCTLQSRTLCSLSATARIGAGRRWTATRCAQRSHYGPRVVRCRSARQRIVSDRGTPAVRQRRR